MKGFSPEQNDKVTVRPDELDPETTENTPYVDFLNSLDAVPLEKVTLEKFVMDVFKADAQGMFDPEQKDGLFRVIKKRMMDSSLSQQDRKDLIDLMNASVAEEEWRLDKAA